MADVKQMKKIIPLTKCEITFGQYVRKLMFVGIQINPFKQPQSNSVGSRYMSHCWTSAFDYHLNHGFIVLKNNL